MFDQLPREIQSRARQAWRRFQVDSTHPGLQFKQLRTKLPLWSVRINDSYRAVGIMKSDAEIIWFFIGTHPQYDKLLANR